MTTTQAMRDAKETRALIERAGELDRLRVEAGLPRKAWRLTYYVIQDNESGETLGFRRSWVRALSLAKRLEDEGREVVIRDSRHWLWQYVTCLKGERETNQRPMGHKDLPSVQ